MDLSVLQALESLRCPFLTVLFSVFTFLGEETFLIAAIAVVYYVVDKKQGELFMTTVLTATSLNGVWKDVVRRPRPYQAGVVSRVEVDNFLVSTAELNASYSFPSGHAMNGGSFYAAIAAKNRKYRWVIFACAAALVLVMLSRCYFGVHYPTDVLVGGAAGVCIGVFWTVLYEKKPEIAPLVFTCLAAVVALSLLFIRSEDTFKAVGGMLGGGVGILVERKWIDFSMPDRWWKGGVRILLGVGVLLGLKAALKALFPAAMIFHAVRYFIVMAVAAGVLPLCFQPLKI